MRYIKIPEPVEITTAVPDSNGKLPTFQFKEVIINIFGSDKLWRKDDAHVAAYLDMLDAIEGKKPGDYFIIEDETWEKLKTVIQNIDMNPQIVPFLMKLVRAVTSAPSKKPEPKEATEASS